MDGIENDRLGGPIWFNPGSQIRDKQVPGSYEILVLLLGLSVMMRPKICALKLAALLILSEFKLDKNHGTKLAFQISCFQVSNTCSTHPTKTAVSAFPDAIWDLERRSNRGLKICLVVVFVVVVVVVDVQDLVQVQ